VEIKAVSRWGYVTLAAFLCSGTYSIYNAIVLQSMWGWLAIAATFALGLRTVIYACEAKDTEEDQE
jgi:hypothetical protein